MNKTILNFVTFYKVTEEVHVLTAEECFKDIVSSSVRG